MTTDAELIKAARSDPEAFGELYRRHATAVNRWFRGRTDDRVAEDLTAETFAQAVLSLRRFRDEADGSAAPWLFGIAKNLLRRYRDK
jgi:DNA-directed RNA polymerase specialized sigma24 family protein